MINEDILNHPLFFFVIDFLLSLICTFVLFKFLKSSASIIKPTWRAGGAIAGFIIIFSMSFYFTDSWIDKYEIWEQETKSYDINGVILLDSALYHDGTEIIEMPPSERTLTNNDGSFTLKSVKFYQNKISGFRIMAEREKYITIQKEFDTAEFEINEHKLIISIKDTIKLKKIPKEILERYNND